MRKQLLLSAAISVIAASAALAADLPSRTSAPSFEAPVEAPIAFNWTGFYAGLNGGYGWNSSSWQSVGAPAFTNFSNNAGGFVGGVTAGYNYQINQFVVGIEGNAEYSGVRASGACGAVVGSNCKTKQSWIGDLDGKIGIGIDRALIYATGGVGFTDYSFSSPTPAPAMSWAGGSRVGWTLGAGMDYAITNNWVAGVTYKYYDFGTQTQNSSPAGTNVKFRETENTLLGRVMYKFGAPASGVVARY